MDLALERASLVALLRPPGEFKWAPLRDVLLETDVPPSVLLEEKRQSGGAFGAVDDLVEHAARLIDQWESDGTRFLTYLDPEYPRQLREVHDLPPFVFGRGRLWPRGERERGISIVGSRSAGPDALASASLLAERLAQQGVPVVSGLAAGIDAAAHTAALRADGRTVGIIGTGIDRYYPKSSEHLQRRIESGGGLVLSQFWPGTGPTRFNFPMRNAVMSAFSAATVIVEASEKSGTKHQAFRAITHGRPLVIWDAVAKETSWGRKLASDPDRLDVSVVSSVDEAAQVAFDKAKPVRAVFPGIGMRAASW
ncbi:DNA processing protein [Sinomonas atrocyanea]|uniref:DNA-processing protein DprA n=1 Tax=Sinomonas atrocyanea TaxID=37927 RepID=UPI002783372B|nr:DNA-processing protein DprA [Sinomonas atrocyanea]MDP9885496.1 DNA processing protein [Sinomonas atrocyanea]